MSTLLAYQDPDSPMTLAEGLDEYRSHSSGLVQEEQLSPEMAALFHAHDLCHVLFGCDTSPEQEMELNAWSLFGTTLGWRDYVRYGRSAEVQAIGRDFRRRLGLLGVLWFLARSLPGWWRIFLRCRRMPRRWPVQRRREFLHRPLCEIRTEYRIRPSLHHRGAIATAPAAGGDAVIAPT